MIGGMATKGEGKEEAYTHIWIRPSGHRLAHSVDKIKKGYTQKVLHVHPDSEMEIQKFRKVPHRIQFYLLSGFPM
jgi:hypothetical protein